MQGSTPEDVLEFWFGEPDAAAADDARGRRWYGAEPATDREIAGRFGACVEAALAGGLSEWAATARGRLALVILLDQFTRNMFRGSPRAFSGDARARELARATLDAPLAPIERAFLFHPFQHSEALADQQLSVRLFAELCASAPPAQASLYDSFLRYAKEHCELIRRFGRFPHRNALLSRPSTPEERQHLAQDGRRFGQ